MRFLTIALIALVILIQYPLWLGKGGWLRISALDRQVTAEKAKNDKLKARNDKLQSEIADLKRGTDALEERARYELGMVKKDETFVQIVKKKK